MRSPLAIAYSITAATLRATSRRCRGRSRSASVAAFNWRAFRSATGTSAMAVRCNRRAPSQFRRVPLRSFHVFGAFGLRRRPRLPRMSAGFRVRVRGDPARPRACRGTLATLARACASVSPRWPDRIAAHARTPPRPMVRNLAIGRTPVGERPRARTGRSHHDRQAVSVGSGCPGGRVASARAFSAMVGLQGECQRCSFSAPYNAGATPDGASHE